MGRRLGVCLWVAISIAVTGCGKSRGHDIVACKAATGAGAPPQVSYEEVRACMAGKGYRLNAYTNGCGDPASPATGGVLHADCWLAPGQAPANYPFQRSQQ